MGGPKLGYDRSAPWMLCGFLFLATTLNYLDRQTLSILAPTIQREMSLDNEALGWLFSAFYYSYTLSQFAIGLILDRYNLRWAYALSVLAWSAVTAMTGMAGSFAALLLFRILLGVTESGNWPAAMRIVARALPPKDRPLGNGIFTSGTSVGALIAPPLILGAAAWFGWRWTFVMVGAFGAVWWIGWMAYTRGPRFAGVWKPADPVGPGKQQARTAVYREILTTGQFWRVFAVAVLVNPVLYYNLNWLPTYFVQQRGVEPEQQKWLLMGIFLALDLGYLACGAAVLLLCRAGKTVQTARRMVFLTATALLLPSAALPFLSGLDAAVGVLAVVNFGVGLWIAMYLTMAQEVSSTHVSTAAGLLGGSGSLAGAVAMWAVGRVTQQTGSFTIPMVAVAVAAVFAGAGGMAASRTRLSNHPIDERN